MKVRERNGFRLARAKALRSKGFSIREISEQMGVFRTTLQRWLKVQRPRPSLGPELVTNPLTERCCRICGCRLHKTSYYRCAKHAFKGGNYEEVNGFTGTA